MFDYASIPKGFYDEIFETSGGMRKFWHWHKFNSVTRALRSTKITSLLDVGCFAGSFLGRFMNDRNISCLGVDILEDQIEYASTHFENDLLKFKYIDNFDSLKNLLMTFDAVTLIEVIEHLNALEIQKFFQNIDELLSVGGSLIITTPNYISVWPFLELMLKYCSDVSYEEQHLTKFSYFNFESKMEKIYPLFTKKYRVIDKFTSHFFTPYISILNYTLAVKMSEAVSPSRWYNPFGPILMIHLQKVE